MKKGFTLIELLIVIGILGILAAGLLAAIDPLEQLKRGRDTQRRNIAVELNNALLRFYAVQGSMPWGTGAQAATNVASATGIINLLTGAGELKTTFQQGMANLGNSRPIYIIAETNSASVYTCFDPESRSISSDPSTIYTDQATPPGTGAACPNATGVCYFCVR